MIGPRLSSVGFQLRCLSAVVILLLIVTGAHPTFATASALRASDIVDRQGRLQVPTGYTGSIDVAGYALATAADGSPRWVAQSAVSTPDRHIRGIPFGQVRFGCGPAGIIRAAVRMPNGDLVLGGDFDACGNEPAKDLVRWDGRRWHAMGKVQYSQHGVYTMALKGGDLYVGTDSIISTVENRATNYIARWDGTQWHTVSCQGCEPDGPVHALAFVGDLLYVGGEFGSITVDGTARINAYHMAVLDGTTWHALESDSTSCLTGVDATVTTLASDGVNVYAGGGFTHALGCGSSLPANRIARWDGAHWSTLGSGTSNGLDGTVNALLYAAGSLYVGGSFNAAGSSPAASVARWDGAAWHSVGDLGILGEVDALAFRDDQLYAGGNFRATGDGPALRVARFAQGTWRAMDQGVGTSDNGDTSHVGAILADDRGVAAFGDFTRTPTLDAANGAAQWNGTAWAPFADPSGATMIDGRVNAIAVRGAEVFIGGYITRAGGTQVHNIARWNGSAWSALPGAGGEGIDGEVRALAVTPTNVYVGGDFAHAGNVPAGRVARWDGSGWHAMGEGIVGASDQVSALAANSDDSVYIAGTFALADGHVVNHIARWDGNAWGPLAASGGSVGVCGTIHALAAAGDGRGVYVGGRFPQPPCGTATDVGHTVSLWNGGAWFPLREYGAPEGLAADSGNEAYALLRDADALYIGGHLRSVADDGTVRQVVDVVKWNITPQQWEFLSSTGFARSEPVSGLATSGTAIYATRYTDLLQYAPDSDHQLSWTSAAEIDAGLHTSAINATGGEVFIGGDFLGWATPHVPGSTRVPSAGIVAFIGDEIFASGFQ